MFGTKRTGKAYVNRKFIDRSSTVPNRFRPKSRKVKIARIIYEMLIIDKLFSVEMKRLERNQVYSQVNSHAKSLKRDLGLKKLKQDHAPN